MTEHRREGARCCSHAHQDTQCSPQSESSCQTPDSSPLRTSPIVSHGYSLLPELSLSLTSALSDVELEEVTERQPVPRPGHYSRGRNWGIQGEHNSCYIDSTLFALFALTSEFDSLLTPVRGGPDQGEPLANEIRLILLQKIINPLRK